MWRISTVPQEPYKYIPLEDVRYAVREMSGKRNTQVLRNKRPVLPLGCALSGMIRVFEFQRYGQAVWSCSLRRTPLPNKETSSLACLGSRHAGGG